MSQKIGIDCKLYIKAGARSGAGLPVTPTLAAFVKDVTLTLETDEADTTTRANNGWKASEPTLKSASISFEQLWRENDTVFGILKDAFFNKSVISVAALTGAIDEAGSEGLVADMKVTKFTRKEPLNEAVSVDVEIKPATSDYAPEWVVVD